MQRAKASFTALRRQISIGARRLPFCINMKIFNCFVAIALLATVVLADGPQFIASPSSFLDDGTLWACFHEVGLGANAVVHYSVSASATVTKWCINRSQHAQGHPPQIQTCAISGSAEFTAVNSGQIIDGVKVRI